MSVEKNIEKLDIYYETFYDYSMKIHKLQEIIRLTINDNVERDIEDLADVMGEILEDLGNIDWGV